MSSGTRPSRASTSGLGIALLAAILATTLNACKPLDIDDTTYSWYARQIASHPADPYGFSLLYFQQPLSANHVLAPPVLPYWWASAIACFGERPVLWRLWLFPFVLLLALAVRALGRRFAPGLQSHLAWLTLFSPAVLPGLNLMTDVPALALTLSGLALFIHATERGSVWLVIGSGLAAGLAVETKYTGFLAPATMLAYALAHRRFRFWLVAAAVAGALFISWECFVMHRYGESHFIYHVWVQSSAAKGRLHLALPLLFLLGGVAPYLAAFGFFALGRPILAIAAAVIACAGYGLLAVGPAWARQALFAYPQISTVGVSAVDLLFAALGGAIVALTFRLARRALQSAGTSSAWQSEALRHDIQFLVAWVLIEAAGYFLLSPFPAARRVMGLVVALSVLLAHAATRAGLTTSTQRQATTTTLAAVVLGLGFFTIGYRDAVAEKQAIEDARRWIQMRQANAVVHYVGYWGFQFYAEQAGWKQVIPLYRSLPDRLPLPQTVPLPAPTVLQAGDWVVAPEPPIPQQLLALGPDQIELVHRVEVGDGLPLRLNGGYFNSPFPLQHLAGARAVALVARVKQTCLPPPG